MSTRSIAGRRTRVKRPGVYSITGPTGKVYVGSTCDLPYRWNRHRSDLRNGKHPNKALQADYDRYGLEGFTFAVLEECPLARCDAQEKHWMWMTDSDRTGYNAHTSNGVCRTGREDATTETPRGAWLKVFAN